MHFKLKILKNNAKLSISLNFIITGIIWERKKRHKILFSQNSLSLLIYIYFVVKIYVIPFKDKKKKN